MRARPRGWGLGGCLSREASRRALEDVSGKMGGREAFLTRDQPSKARRWG